MKRRFQRTHSYIFDDTERARKHDMVGKEKTEKSSFVSLEKAIDDSMMWIDKTESWIDITTTRIEIIDKETGEPVWTYKK